MIRIAACDDNSLLLSMLKDMLEDYAQQSSDEIEVFTFNSSEALLNEVAKNGSFDIYILDIVMPGINGMEAAVSLRSALDKGIIIFLSASVEYAVKSYDVEAFYYLVKPVDPTKLYSVLDNACSKIRKEKLSNLFEIRTADGAKRVDIAEVSYANIDDRSVCYHLRDGDAVTGRKLRGSFSEEVSQLLDDRRFALCGTALAINLNMIDAVDDESILLKDGTLLYPSKSACSSIKKQWLIYTSRK